MKYLLILVLFFPLMSYSQSDIKIGEEYSLKLDNSKWEKVSGNKGYKHKKIPDFFFSVNKTPISPGQKNMTSMDFLNNASNTIKKSGYQGLVISDVKTYGEFIYYIFSYMEDPEGKIKNVGVYAISKKYPDIRFMFGGKNVAEEVVESNFKGVLDTVSALK